MLLCFTPSLYCDTTDSWRLPSKWQRAAIAAAGMYVELIIASCAALVWLVTKEGTLHYLAASTMLVCSISTLLINMNPLLKYDGYYILSDLWNVPNLAEQGSEAFRKVVVSFFSTDKRNAAPARVVSALDANTGLLAGYSVAAFSYRIFVLGVILWLGWVTLVPLGLGLVAVLLTMIVAVGFVANYARSLTKLVGELKSSGTIRFIRLFLAGAVVVGVIVLICSFPLPVRVQARGVADFAGKIAQFAPEDAQLVYAASPGHGCRKGETLFRLRAPELELELLKLEGEIDLLATQIDALESRQANDSSAVFKLPALQERLLDRRARIEAVQLIRSELTIQAQEAGTLIASQAYAPTVLTAHHDDRVRVGLASTSRIGAFVQRGARLGWLVTDDSVVVNALVPEEDMRRLVLGMQVDIRFDSRPWTNVEGRVTTIATEPLSEIPSELLGDGAIVATRTPAGALATEKPHYEVEIQVARRTIDASELSGQTARKRDMLPGSLATVQIQTHSATLWETVYDYLYRNLRPIY